jgi:hypothetical protein
MSTAVLNRKRHRKNPPPGSNPGGRPKRTWEAAPLHVYIDADLVAEVRAMAAQHRPPLTMSGYVGARLAEAVALDKSMPDRLGRVPAHLAR